MHSPESRELFSPARTATAHDAAGTRHWLRRTTRQLAATLVLGVVGIGSALAVDVSLSNLPQEAQTTYESIHKGAPFPYTKDGSVFGNRESKLPSKPKGYYLEYTVPTPGAKNRGAQRIVCGGDEPTNPDACYYTADHYNSFSRIVE